MKYFIIILFIYMDFLFPQSWFPLQKGNTWQYLKTYSSIYPQPDTIYSLHTLAITGDTVIKFITYYVTFNSDGNQVRLIRFSPYKNRIVEWKNNSEVLLMDFNKYDGDFFWRGSIPCRVVTGTVNLFSQIFNYKGCECNLSNLQIYNMVYDYYIENLGLYNFKEVYSHSPVYFNEDSKLTGAILYDQSGSANYISGFYQPVITLTPINYINNRFFNLDITVDHYYNVLPQAFSFISGVFVESFYSKGDTIITNPDHFTLPLAANKFRAQILLDTLLMQAGYLFNYRVKATDKALIPQISYSPDSGYYSCRWDFTVSVKEDNLEPLTYELHQNYPNPFNSSTKISFTIPNVGTGLSLSVLKVYDVLGNEVATLMNEYKPAGSYEIEFDASNYNLTSGIFIYKLIVGDFTSSKKMILMK